ncbi:hypothetical protein LCGC14_1561980 [marine sediment metagenome]|uniref:Uncharacterized protein n=1 Tax=marine sediment metagenome TaxID=412755 RepID=A0A0F9IM70_9ZZZZ
MIYKHIINPIVLIRKERKSIYLKENPLIKKIAYDKGWGGIKGWGWVYIDFTDRD